MPGNIQVLLLILIVHLIVFLRTGAILLAQWCQPTTCITYNAISEQLNDIANQVRAELKSKYADHPAVKPLNVDVIGNIFILSLRFRILMNTTNA